MLVAHDLLDLIQRLILLDIVPVEDILHTLPFFLGEVPRFPWRVVHCTSYLKGVSWGRAGIWASVKEGAVVMITR